EVADLGIDLVALDIVVADLEAIGRPTGRIASAKTGTRSAVGSFVQIRDSAGRWRLAGFRRPRVAGQPLVS
ncbi:MAG TPA: hypothetical protein DFS52_04320, partial [Myxococcales bacterium]|nr:hypothetical protein [Myxococcales bacterium]